ncbi:unnamed protein product [Trypanosoma congolense IL3000]|uniref:WGS project CAEQ00000000 data, annotated contig 647 n=1 Tax=Trypanosoma congolense (strain IL3000) TaxID=1068625 RepID=F9WHG9_TRYCI|nr:unnamed protein product [Trypanosoma congolense IL3000]
MSKGTHATPCALVLVLLCVVHPLQMAVSAKEGPIASTKEYIILPNGRFNEGGQYLVSHGATERICREEGAILATDHSEATDAAINEVHSTLSHVHNIYSYLGGDATFSASEAQDAGSRCKEADNSTSIHCVYRWNRGLFDATTTNGIGEAFWRGSYRSTPGAGSMNDFPFRWIKDYPKFGVLYPMSRRHYRESKRTWFDVTLETAGSSTEGSVLDERNSTLTGIVGHIQHETPVAPPSPLSGPEGSETASEELNGTNVNETESDDSSSGVSSTEAPAGKVNGGVLAVAILLPIIAIALLLLLWYFCFRRRDEKEDAPLSLREVYSPAECPSPVEAPLTSEGGGAAEGGSPNASPAVAQ